MPRPLDAARAHAEASANLRGASLHGLGLRLFADSTSRSDSGASSFVGEVDPSPFQLGRVYELGLTPGARRDAGAHLTPERVARNLVRLLPPPEPDCTFLDPAVGGGAFLLAAADELVAAGCPPAAVLEQVRGFDLDPGAVAVAEAAMALWAIDHDLTPRRLDQIQVGDGLLVDLPVVDRVVGNPPFLTQLRSSSSHSSERRNQLRERWGDLVGAYTDDAWLFLAASLDALGATGSLALVQPVSILAARHGQAVRERVGSTAQIRALWVARDRVFDAAVQVCGIVATRGAAQAGDSGQVSRFVGVGFEPSAPLSVQPTAQLWGAAASAVVGVPEVSIAHHKVLTLGDLATATAGFRDQFYGFVPFVSEAVTDTRVPGTARLTTVGMIDVLSNSWGRRESRFAKRVYRRPVIDVDRLRIENVSLGDWVAARLRPKLLMATQTKVVEVWVDTVGDAIPATPVLSIEPLATDEERLWLLAAALTSPAVSAHFMAAKFGAAMSLNAMKLAARDVLQTPLPPHEAPWHEAALLIQHQPLDHEQFALLMAAAYGIKTPELTTWWLGRI